MIQEIRSARDRITAQFAMIDAAPAEVDLRLVGLMANQMALRCAGLVEKSVQLIVAEYARRRSNETISRYVQKHVEWENSLNCEKIARLLEWFDSSWWAQIEASASEESRLAIDSLKTIRDQLAHGRDNGTGLVNIKRYFAASCDLIDKLEALLLPN